MELLGGFANESLSWRPDGLTGRNLLKVRQEGIWCGLTHAEEVMGGGVLVFLLLCFTFSHSILFPPPPPSPPPSCWRNGAFRIEKICIYCVSWKGRQKKKSKYLPLFCGGCCRTYHNGGAHCSQCLLRPGQRPFTRRFPLGGKSLVFRCRFQWPDCPLFNPSGLWDALVKFIVASWTKPQLES